MIGKYRNFFSRSGFDVDKDLPPRPLSFRDEKTGERLHDNVYYYTAPGGVNTSFYFFDVPGLTHAEKKEIHFRIWNENSADLYFLPAGDEIEIYYAKTNPKLKEEELIDKLPIEPEEKERELLKKISKWHFDTGAFWLEYGELLRKIKNKKQTVDIELIQTLKGLKKELDDEYEKTTADETQRREMVQALIDRTLFIKFLEDKQIINSFFYGRFFADTDAASYKDFLKNKDRKAVNLLFAEINRIFNSSLFQEPSIPEGELTDSVLESLHSALGGYDFESGQLSLFDFQFDIIPIEFIGHIYEVFLEQEQAAEGIYYTPEGLADFIVDSVIGNGIGPTMDPSCGSGVFLVMAFRRLLKNANIKAENTLELIKKRGQLMVDNIFGVEKANAAGRLTRFSLYLELLEGIDPGEIKAVIKEQVERSGECRLFAHKFDENIIIANTLETDPGKKLFPDKKFDFIVGNPPWKEITKTDEEHEYWRLNKKFISGKQLSQCFLIKVKDWVKQGTRCGFVINSSNFYNEQTDNFPRYFFSEYSVESFYNLSKLKGILFRKSKESASVVIFSRGAGTNNKVVYYSAEMNEFTKIFGNIFIRDADIIHLLQSELISGQVKLRDYLVGSIGDVDFLKFFTGPYWQPLENYLAGGKEGKPFLHEGLTFVSTEATRKYFDIGENDWKTLSKKEQKAYKQKFIAAHSRQKPGEGFNIPYLKPENISKYKITSVDSYMGDNRSGLERGRDDEIFCGKKLVCIRVGGKMKAVYTKDKVYFSFAIYVLKLDNDKFYYFIQALLNSRFVEYFLSIRGRKRMNDSFPSITISNLKRIPLPINPDENILDKINELSKRLLLPGVENEKLEKEIENCIYDLYRLDIIQRRRIDDFFIKPKELVNKCSIEGYCRTFFEVMKNFLEENSCLDFAFYIEKSLPIAFCGVKISFSKSTGKQEHGAPKVKEMTRFFGMEHLRKLPKFSVLLPKEKIWGDDCLYIIKDRYLKSWSRTKAVEDAREEIGKLVNK